MPAEQGFDDHTVMSISGHSSTRMLERYTHPREERRIGALDLPWMVTIRSQTPAAPASGSKTADEIARILKETGREVGGRQEDRTPDLRIANAALSQLS